VKKLENMTDEEITEYRQDLDEKMQELRDKKAEAQAEVDNRALRKKVEALSDQERAALTQMVQADEIPSAEAFGNDDEVEENAG
jgi:hypothetical protein